MLSPLHPTQVPFYAEIAMFLSMIKHILLREISRLQSVYYTCYQAKGKEMCFPFSTFEIKSLEEKYFDAIDVIEDAFDKLADNAVGVLFFF